VDLEEILDLRGALKTLDGEEQKAIDLVYFNPPPKMQFQTKIGRPHNGLYRDVAFALYPEKGEAAAIAKLNRILRKAYDKLRKAL
jgi:hypothetical protein